MFSDAETLLIHEVTVNLNIAKNAILAKVRKLKEMNYCADKQLVDKFRSMHRKKEWGKV